MGEYTGYDRDNGKSNGNYCLGFRGVQGSTCAIFIFQFPLHGLNWVAVKELN